MKKIFLLILGIILLATNKVNAQASTINTLNPWGISGTTITTRDATKTVTIPTLGGSGTRCLQANSSGLISAASSACGTGGGGGADGNWVFFNGSGIRLATSTNQVLIGPSATSSYAKVEIASTSAGAPNEALLITNSSMTAGTLANIFFSPSTATGILRGARIGGYQEGGNVIGLDFGTGQGAAITSKAYLSGAGNFGVGTSSPYARLSVAGEAVAGYFTATSTTASVFPLANITKLSNLTSNGFVKTSGGDGTLSIDTTSYQASGNYITALTGDVTASGPGSVAATLATVNSNVGSFTNANITVNAKGLITAASNGSAGGGTGTVGTSSVPVKGNLAYWTTDTATPALLGTIATTSVTCSGSTTCTSFTVIGSSPITISSTGGAGGGADGNWTYSTSEGGYIVLATTTNKVGIGTTTPYAKLSIVGTGTGTTTLAIRPTTAQTANILDMYTVGGTLSSVVSSAGLWGLGTTTPTQRLDVAGNIAFGSRTDGYGRIFVNQMSARSLPTIALVGADDGTTNEINIGGGTGLGYITKNIKLHTAFNDTTSGSSVRLSINNSGLVTIAQNLVVSGQGSTTFAGNVGIGTTSPGTVLAVSATTSSSTILIDNKAKQVLSGDIVHAIYGTTQDESSLTNRVVTGIEGVASADYAGIGDPTDMVFKTQNTTGSLTERLNLRYNKVVAFGSTSPYAQYSFNADGGTGGSSGPIMAVGSSTQNAFVIANNAKVGIGSSTPGLKLSVNGPIFAIGDTNAALYLGDPNDANSRPRIIQNGPSGIATYNSFRDNGTAKFTLGYGAAGTTPTGSFFISRTSDFASPDFMLTSTGNLALGLLGNVGIATTTPSTRFQVNEASATTTIYASVVGTTGVRSTTLGARIILQDTSGGTCTEITTQSGVMNAKAITCP